MYIMFHIRYKISGYRYIFFYDDPKYPVMSTYLKSCAGPELFTLPFTFLVTKQLWLNIKQPGIES